VVDSSPRHLRLNLARTVVVLLLAVLPDLMLLVLLSATPIAIKTAVSIAMSSLDSSNKVYKCPVQTIPFTSEMLQFKILR
jgi:hypothetical protein